MSGSRAADSSSSITRKNFLGEIWVTFLKARFATIEALNGIDSNWESAGDSADFQKPCLTVLKGFYILAICLENQAMAWSARCPWDGGPLEWEIWGNMLACPRCQSRFNAMNGESEGEEGDPGLFAFPARVEKGQLWIKLG